MRVTDALMAFPAVLLAIAIAAALGPVELNAVIALPIVYIPRTARIVRASVLVVREMEYVQAAIAVGASHWRILRRHILPNCMAPLIVQLTFIFAYAVLSEAVLSFLGLGAAAADADLGQHHRRGPPLHARGGLDHADPGHRAGDHRARPQPARRRAARRARSAPEGSQD